MTGQSDLDYEGLMELAKIKAREEAEILFPFWKHKEREDEYLRLTDKYYKQYTSPRG